MCDLSFNGVGVVRREALEALKAGFDEVNEGTRKEFGGLRSMDVRVYLCDRSEELLKRHGLPKTFLARLKDFCGAFDLRGGDEVEDDEVVLLSLGYVVPTVNAFVAGLLISGRNVRTNFASDDKSCSLLMDVVVPIDGALADYKVPCGAKVKDVHVEGSAKLTVGLPPASDALENRLLMFNA